MTAIALAVMAAACIGAGDFLGGIVGRRDRSNSALLATYGVVLVVITPIAAARDGLPTDTALGWGLAMGAFWAIGILALVRGIADGRVVVVIPTAGVLSALIPVAADLATGGRPTASTTAGIAVGVLAVALTGLGHRGKGEHRSVGWSLLMGAIGGVTTGISLILMDQAADEGLWPLAAAALAATVVMLGGLTLAGRLVIRRSNAILPAVGMGLLVAASFVAMMIAFRRGSLTTVAVIVSQYPAVTILLAAVVWRQRPRGIQYLGVALAMAAVGLIAAGA